MSVNINWNHYQTMELEQIIGLSEAKEIIHRDLTLRSVQDLPQRIISLEGAPGTCKSTLVLTKVKEFMTKYPNRFDFIELRTSDLSAKVTEISERVQIFWGNLRKKNTHIIMFIDESDDVFATRKGAGHIKSERTINLIQEINKEIPNLYIICATNRPTMIDSAIRNRFSKRIYCPYPTTEELKELVKIHLPFLPEMLQNILIRDIQNSAFKYNGRDLKHLHDELLEITRFEKLTNPDYILTSQELFKQFEYIENAKEHLKDDYIDMDITKEEIL